MGRAAAPLPPDAPHERAPGVFQAWLGQDIAAARDRLRWFRELRDQLDA